jgi:selenocysteine-specific elongation factor
MAKLVVLGSSATVKPNESAFCQIVLAEPLLALRGDHFIVRDETAQRTLGGGVVIHPWPGVHRRREPGLLDTLARLRRGDPASVAQIFLDQSDEFALPIAPLSQFLDVRAEETNTLLHAMDTTRVVTLEGEPLYTTTRKWKALQDALVAALRDFHAAHPLAPGQDMEELRDRLPSTLAPKLFRSFVEQLHVEKVVVRDGSLLRLPSHAIALDEGEKRLVDRIKQLLAENPLSPPDLPQLERDTQSGRAKLIGVLRVLERERSIVRVGTDLYFLSETMEQVKRQLRDELAGGRDITPAAFRDRFGTTRKYTIPLLEYLDREGVTMRVGDKRRLR